MVDPLAPGPKKSPSELSTPDSSLDASALLARTLSTELAVGSLSLILCTKTGRPVLVVLETKRPNMREPLTLGTPDGIFEPHASVPVVVPMVVTSDVVE